MSLQNLLGKLKNRVKYGSDSKNLILKNIKKNDVVAEIGVWKGEFSNRILENTECGKLYLIDPYLHVDEFENSRYGGENSSQQKMDKIHSEVCDRFSESIKLGKVEVIRKESSKALVGFEDDFFDLIYIDGDHRYDAVMNDLKLSLQKVKPGGFIGGDDYGIKGWWNNGVQDAVDEFRKRNKDIIRWVEIFDFQFLMKKN